jgi:glycosyltransferase, family 1
VEKRQGRRRVLLFGTGEYYQVYKYFFSRVEIVALLDNDSRKQGDILDGIMIRKPEEAIHEEYDGIYLLSVYASEIRQQLLALGVPPEKIFDRDQIYDMLQENLPEREMIQLGQIEQSRCWNEGKSITVLAQDMEFYGATIALYQAVKILKNVYSNVVVVTMRNGPMREHFSQIGVPVLLDPFLCIVTLDDITWLKKCRLLLINTNLFWGLFRRNHTQLPIIWWLHDPELLYQGQFCEKINECYTNNIRVYAVGEMAAEAFQKRCPHWPRAGILKFGIEDFYQEGHKPSSHKMIFAVIGAIDPVKGQDIFVDAVCRLSDKIRMRCEFWIIGREVNERFAAKVKAQAANVPEVQFRGLLDRRAIQKAYQEIDVLVCPSLEESMSIVTIEAMMNRRPNIVSDQTGIAKFITDGESGLIFRAGDGAALAEKMTWLAEDEEKRRSIGEKARELYEREFSPTTFEKDLRHVVDAALTS